MPEERLNEYLDSLDAAADLLALQRRATLPIAATIRPRRMDMSAHDSWKVAWLRGLVGDAELMWYVMTIHKHPASWIGFLNQYL